MDTKKMSKAILNSGNKNDIAFKIKHVSNSKQICKNNVAIIKQGIITIESVTKTIFLIISPSFKYYSYFLEK